MRLAMPTSTLFHHFEEELSNYADIIELRGLGFNLPVDQSYLFHTKLNFVAKWGNSEKDHLQTFKNNYYILGVSPHIFSRFRYQKRIRGGPPLLGLPMSLNEMLENARKNTNIIRRIFGENVLIMPENIPYRRLSSYEVITDADFITKIITKNKINMLLDIPHAQITAFNKNIPFASYLNKLPLDKVKQIHFSSPIINNGGTYDAHNAPDNNMFST